MRSGAHQIPARRVAAALQFQREHQHRQFRLIVCLPRRIETLALQIAELNEACAMRDAAEADHPRLLSAAQQRKQLRRQRVVTEIIGSELHFETVGRGLPGRQSHNARVVDEQIERRVRGGQASGEIGYRGKICQIEHVETDFSIRRIFETASRPLASLRPASTTSAPACASRIAV